MQLTDLERPDVVAALRQMAAVHADAAASAAAQAEVTHAAAGAVSPPTVKDRDIRQLLATSVRLRDVARRVETEPPPEQTTEAAPGKPAKKAAAAKKGAKPAKATAPAPPRPPVSTVLGIVDDDTDDGD